MLQENRKKYNSLIILLCSIFTAVTLTMNMDMVSDEFIASLTNSTNNLYKIFLRLIYSVDEFGITGIFIIFFSFVMYNYSVEIGKTKTEEKVIGVLMALAALFGKAFDEFGSTIIMVTGIVQTLKTVIILIGYVIFFVAVVKCARNYISTHLVLGHGFDLENSKKYMWAVFGIIVTVWSLHIVGYYPGLFMGDTEDIIYMAYNYHTGIADRVELISEDVLLVDHHSVLYTLILGFFVKLGRTLFSNENTGIFVYSFVQALFMAWVLSYSLYKLKKIHVNAGIRTLILAFFILFPWIPRYAIMATKDTLFSGFLLLYLITIMDIVDDKKNRISSKNMLKLVAYSVIMFLLRKNGLYVTVLSLPFLLMINKKWVKQLVIACVCIMGAQVVYGSVLLPAAQITDGSVSAALSVPLQQTSRYLKYYGDEVTEEEKAAIDAVVDYSVVSTVYWPDRSDWAKYAWRKEATGEEIKDYFITWFKMLCKKPLTYVAATAHNCYGYFYPVVLDLYEFEKSSVGSMANCNRDNYFAFGMTDNKISEMCRDILKLLDAAWMRIPLLNILCTSAFYIWLLIFAWTKSIVDKDRKLLMLVIPMLMLMLTILTGPCNGNVYHRFTYPVAMCIPVICAYAVRSKTKEADESIC